MNEQCSSALTEHHIMKAYWGVELKFIEPKL